MCHLLKAAVWHATSLAMDSGEEKDTNAQHGTTGMELLKSSSLFCLVAVPAVPAVSAVLVVSSAATAAVTAPPRGFRSIDDHMTVSSNSHKRGNPSLFLSLHVLMGLPRTLDTRNSAPCVLHHVSVAVQTLSFGRECVATIATISGQKTSVRAATRDTTDSDWELASLEDPSKTPTTAWQDTLSGKMISRGASPLVCTAHTCTFAR